MNEADQNSIDPSSGAPPVVDEDALLEDLAYVLRTCGAARFFTNSILTPTKDCFPDSWAPNQTGVRILAKRLMLYAGLNKIEPEVEVYTDPDALVMRRSRHGGLHRGAAAYFMGIEDGKAIFACESGNIAQPETLIGTMGHEVAHAFRAYHGVTIADQKHEEELTDITSVYLGFGVFACNSSRTYEKSGTVQGAFAITRESMQRLGYLPPRALAFLFACQLIARGYAARDVRRLRSFLKSNHRQYFSESLGDLKRSRSALLHELGVTEQDADRMVATSPKTTTAAPIVLEGIRESQPGLAVEPVGPTCPHCGQSIDYRVETCPHCRATISARLPWPAAIAVVAIGIAIVLWMTWPR